MEKQSRRKDPKGKYRIAWLPGDGIGIEVLEAARIVLDKLDLNAEYIHGDIGWTLWCSEGDAFPQRTIELLKNVDAAMFGAITSKPAKTAETELAPELKGKGLAYRSPIVRMRQLFDLYVCLDRARRTAGIRSISRKTSTWWSSAKTPKICTRESNSVRFPVELAETLAKLSKPFARFKILPAINMPFRARSIPARARNGSSAPPSSSPGKFHRKKVTVVHKANVVRATDGLFLETAREWPKTIPRFNSTTPTSTPCACGC